MAMAPPAALERGEPLRYAETTARRTRTLPLDVHCLCQRTWRDPARVLGGAALSVLRVLRENPGLTWRILAALILNYLPALVSLMLIEVVSLQEPSVGWSSNPTFWMRVAFVGTFVSAAVMNQARILIPQVNLTLKHILVIITEAGTVYTGLLLASVLLLLVIKISLKHTIAKVQSADDDFILALQTTLDVFGALYMAKCMQSAGALMVAVGIILVDVAQNTIAVYEVAKQTRSLKSMNKLDSQMKSTNLKYLQAFMHYRKGTDRLAANSLRFAKSTRFSLSQTSHIHLSRLESVQIASSEITTKRSPGSSATVVPLNPQEACPSPDGLNFATSTEGAFCVREDSAIIAKQAVRLLHESEVIAVVEYVEMIVPVLYAIYISILYHLLNARYYQDMRNLTDEKMQTVVTNILIYAFMEMLSLVYVHFMLKQSFGISVFYQLVFTLESEWPIYQCSFFVWLLVVFQLLLDHFGALLL